MSHELKGVAREVETIKVINNVWNMSHWTGSIPFNVYVLLQTGQRPQPVAWLEQNNQIKDLIKNQLHFLSFQNPFACITEVILDAQNHNAIIRKYFNLIQRMNGTSDLVLHHDLNLI